jgi:hypothetical protein
MHHEDHDELVLLRTHLTVALLAVSQLQRKHADSPQVARLSTFALDALLQMRAEMSHIDRLIARLERHQATRDDHLPLPFPRRTAHDEPHERR